MRAPPLTLMVLACCGRLGRESRVGVRVGEAMAQACVCGSYIRTLFLNLRRVFIMVFMRAHVPLVVCVNHNVYLGCITYGFIAW